MKPRTVIDYSKGTPAPKAIPWPKRLRRWACGALVSIFCLLLGWIALFSTDGYRADPRSPRYLLWKHGFLPAQRSTMFIAFGQDRDRESIVMGLTPQELTRKFGRIRRPGNLLSWQQPYLTGLGDCAWLDDSQYVVEFTNGRVSALHRYKG